MHYRFYWGPEGRCIFECAEWHFCLNGVMYLSYQAWEGAAAERAKAVITQTN